MTIDRDSLHPSVLVARLLAAGAQYDLETAEREYAKNREEGKAEAALTLAGKTRSLAEKYIRYAPACYHEELWNFYAHEVSLRKRKLAEILSDLADQVRVLRASAIEQGFNVPDPASFGEPAPAGVLTGAEIIKGRRRHE